MLSLIDGRLVALVHPYPLTGRESSHPRYARGYSTMNCYVLLGDDAATLYSTGYAIHGEALVAQLEGIVGDLPLTLVVPRVEFPSMSNVRAISDRLRLEAIYERVNFFDPRVYYSLSPGSPPETAHQLGNVPCHGISSETSLELGKRVGPLEFFLAELRLLPNASAYDHSTRTLFTGDLFSWVVRDTGDGPWVFDATEETATVEELRGLLLDNRFWWLANADTSVIREWLATLLDRYPAEIIAPDHGCILMGEAVKKHLDLLVECLGRIGSEARFG